VNTDPYDVVPLPLVGYCRVAGDPRGGQAGGPGPYKYGKARRQWSDRCGILAAVTTSRLRQNGTAAAAGRLAASKVPQITVLFWIIKVMTTAQGEAVSDFLALRYGPVIAVSLGATGLAIALTLQFRARRYVAWIYWAAVVMVAVFGTMAADGLHVELGVPYDVSTPFFAVSLAVIFAVWYATEKTLSIHSINTPRREFFYWATVMATFALGTALGDMTAVTLHWGYLTSGVAFTALIAVPAIARWRLGMNPILAFWIAYVVTRPLGASFADYFGVPHRYGGLGLGRGLVGLILTFVIIGFVGYLAATRKDVEEPAAPRAPRRGGQHRQ
jgi:uncharacterized membrane-anchored protein